MLKPKSFSNLATVYNNIVMDSIRYNEEDFDGFLEDLISSGRLESKEEGITKLYLDKGYDALSDKQRYVFDKMVENHSVDECTRCGCPIPWCEMLAALDNGGLCNYCEHMQEKIDKE